MTDINLLTDEELARAADLYIFKAYQAVGAYKPYDYFSVTIAVNCSTSQDRLKIEHRLRVGYNNEQLWTGNNLIRGASVIRRRFDEDAETAPIELRVALPAPVEPEYADFDVLDETTDDLPF